MKKLVASLALLAAFCLPAAALVAGPETRFPPRDVELFRVKCGLCHGLDKTFDVFPPMSRQRRTAVIEDMQMFKPDWISDSERAAIDALLATDDLAGLATAVAQTEQAQKPDSPPTRILAAAHGVAMAVVFFALGIAMALSGLKRLFDRKKLFPRFPGSFVWRRHVLRGKIYILCAIGGLGSGLAIWALSGFAVGSLGHFICGFAAGALFAVGGLTGLRMTRGGGTPGPRLAHLACNLTATALYAANLVTGVFALQKLFG